MSKGIFLSPRTGGAEETSLQANSRRFAGICFDFFLLTLFSGLICGYTATLIAQNIAARTRTPLPEEAVSWLVSSGPILPGICLLFVLLWVLGWMFINSKDALFVFLYRKGRILTMLCVGIWLFFGLNCSSIYYWSQFLEGADAYAPLWGIARIFRSDEWAVWTPFAFSQYHAGYPAVNPMISGGGVDASWISVGGIPAWNTVTLLKPLYWPFLLFGPEVGLSFLSIARFVLLFWVSFRFAMVYTGRSRVLSLTAAAVLTLSPYIQWWYSQSIAEVFIYTQAMLLTGRSYLQAETTGRKIALALLFGYLLGCYVMIGYPGWLISMFYPVLALGIAGAYRCRKKLSLRRDSLACIPILLVLGLILCNALLSRDTLQAVSNSVYPGSRLFTGKSVSWDFSTGLFCVLFPMEFSLPFSNMCDSANFLTFSPAGLVLAVTAMVKRKKADPLSLILMGLEAFLWLFMLLGFPPALAKLTLLSQCTRLQPVVAMIDMILLYRHLAQGKLRLPVWAVLLLTAVSGLLIWLPGAKQFTYTTRTIRGILLLGWLLFFLIYSRDPQKPRTTRRMCYGILCCALLAGGFVNPIQKGTDCVTEAALIRELRELPDDGLYLMEASFPRINAPLLAGKRCFNSTTPYPNPEKWAVLDPQGQYRDIYNRFCHVNTTLIHEDTTFELFAADQINLNLSFRDLEKLNIDYLITRKDYSGEVFADMRLLPVGATEKFHIYRICYD